MMILNSISRIASKVNRQTNPWSAPGVLLLGIHLVLSPLLVCRFTLDPFEPIKIAGLKLTSLCLVGLCFYWLLETPWQAASRIRIFFAKVRSEPLFLGALLFVLSASLSTLTSVSPATSLLGQHESEFGLGTVFAYFVLFLATNQLVRDLNTAHKLLWMPVIASVPVILYALCQTCGADPFAWRNLSSYEGWTRPFSTLSHPNHLAAYLAMTLPITLWLASRISSWSQKVALVGLGILALLVIGLTLSRGAWIAVSGLALVYGGNWCRTRVIRWRVLGYLGLALLLSGLGALVVCQVRTGFLASLTRRFHQFGQISSRFEVWRGSWELFAARPWTGQGLDTFQSVYPAHRSALAWRLDEGTLPFRAHNEILQVLATQGIPGGFAVVLLGWGMIRGLRRSWRCREERASGLALTLTGVVVVYALISLSSFTMAPCGTLIITVAALLARAGRFVPDEAEGEMITMVSPWRKFLALALAACVTLLLAGPLTVRPFQAEVACGSADQMLQTDPVQALAFCEQCVSLEPRRDLYWVKLAAAAQAATNQSRIAAERQRHLLRAREAMEIAMKLNPVAAEHHANHGRLLLDLASEHLADPEDALRDFEKALAGDPNHLDLLILTSQTALNLGRKDLADRYLLQATKVRPEAGKIYFILAVLRTQEENWEAAYTELQHCIQMSGFHPQDQEYHQCLALLAHVELKRGMYLLCEQHSADLLALRPNWPQPGPYHLHALAMEKLGHAEIALLEYQKLLGRFPNYVPAKNGCRRLGEASISPATGQTVTNRNSGG